MAASGIAEHMEARRRQQQMNKKAAWILEKLDSEDLEEKLQAYRQQEGGNMSTYQSELTPSCDQTNAMSTDKQRRDAVHKTQLVEYSAKIPNRYNSTNYSQQW
ncbi:uncharacterized protein LOC135464921 [Liolophura sinensis]|uniref:uncharacterized protein LOC135464921 n=1 Tax=Liolophura sinensis TaxID=3198878 RepID=UPI0031597BE7